MIVDNSSHGFVGGVKQWISAKVCGTILKTYNFVFFFLSFFSSYSLINYSLLLFFTVVYYYFLLRVSLELVSQFKWSLKDFFPRMKIKFYH